MEQRTVQSPTGSITYELTRKRVKNLNLRVRDGKVLVSVPLHTSPRTADIFVLGRAEWIFSALARQSKAQRLPLPFLPEEECRRRLTHSLERMLPLAAALGVPLPQLRLRKMRSQWGNCHYAQGYITLNRALAACPEELQDYVTLHELVHFLHHDHGPEFKATMTRLMPDWQTRRQRLKAYTL